LPGAIHHAVVAVRDLDVSLRFYRDGLGLDLLLDRQVEGDWPELLGAPSRSLRAVFLGDERLADDHSGVLELNLFDGGLEEWTDDSGNCARPRRSARVARTGFDHAKRITRPATRLRSILRQTTRM
jgi:catechol 2,3-dioxygenase-like lactoylglutathione lyase family enzyme